MIKKSPMLSNNLLKPIQLFKKKGHGALQFLPGIFEKEHYKLLTNSCKESIMP
jgi:hypothetical protein